MPKAAPLWLPLLILLQLLTTAQTQRQVIRRPSLVCLLSEDIGDLSCRLTVANLTVGFNDLGAVLRSLRAASASKFDSLHLRVESEKVARLESADLARVSAVAPPVRRLVLLSARGLHLGPCSLAAAAGSPKSGVGGLQELTLSAVTSGLRDAFCSRPPRLQRLSLHVVDASNEDPENGARNSSGKTCDGLASFLAMVLPGLETLQLRLPAACPVSGLSIVGAASAPRLADLALAVDMDKQNTRGGGQPGLEERLRFARLPSLASLRLSLAVPCARGFAFGAGAFADLPRLRRIHLRVLVTGAEADGLCSLFAPGAFAARSPTMSDIRITTGVQTGLNNAGGSLRLNLIGANSQLFRCERSPGCPEQRVHLLAAGRFQLILPPDVAFAENATEVRLSICRPPWRNLQQLMAAGAGRRLKSLVVEPPPGWGRQPLEDDDSDGFEGGVCSGPDEQPEELLDIRSVMAAAVSPESSPAPVLSLWAQLCVCSTSAPSASNASVRLICANLDEQLLITSAEDVAEACARLEIVEFVRRVNSLGDGSSCSIHKGVNISCVAGPSFDLANPPLPPATRHLDLRFGGGVDRDEAGNNSEGTADDAESGESDSTGPGPSGSRLTVGGFLRYAPSLRSLLLLGSRKFSCPHGLATLEDGALSGANGLEHLALRFNPISWLGTGVFAGLTRLRSLDLRFNCYLKLIPSSVLKPALPSLLRLHLPDSLQSGALVGANRLRHLEVALMRRDRLAWTIPAGFIANLPALRSLVVLVGNPWRTLRMSSGSLANLPSLRSLVLRVITHRGGHTVLAPGAFVNLSGKLQHVILDGVDLLTPDSGKSFGADQLVELTRDDGMTANNSNTYQPELQLELLMPPWDEPSDSLRRFLPGQPVNSTKSLALRLDRRPCNQSVGLRLSDLSALLSAFPRLRRFSLTGCVALAAETAAAGSAALAKTALAAAPQLERLSAPARTEICERHGDVTRFNRRGLRISLVCIWPRNAESPSTRRGASGLLTGLRGFAVAAALLWSCLIVEFFPV